MVNCKITPAAVRLYGRCLEIECEVEEAITESMTGAQLLARVDRVLQGDFDHEAEESQIKAILAQDPEYQYVKGELGRQLRLGPDDINPLDLDLEEEWNPDDPRMEARNRAAYLLHDLSCAHLDWICWWRRPSGHQLRVVGATSPGDGKIALTGQAW
jgi:hypothetical protein